MSQTLPFQPGENCQRAGFCLLNLPKAVDDQASDAPDDPATGEEALRRVNAAILELEQLVLGFTQTQDIARERLNTEIMMIRREGQITTDAANKAVTAAHMTARAADNLRTAATYRAVLYGLLAASCAILSGIWIGSHIAIFAS